MKQRSTYQHFDSCGTVVEHDHPHAGRLRRARPAARFEGTPSGIRNGAPVPGEHTCDILREVGCDDAEIEATVAARVLHAENAES